MKMRLALAAATCLALPVVAHAQPVTGPYVSLEAGTSIQNPVGYSESLHNTSGKLQYNVDYAGMAAAGYGFGDGFRVQLGVNDLHNTLHEDDDYTHGHARASGTHSTFGPMVDVLYDIPVGLPIFPYVGAGFGYQWVHANSRSNFAFSVTKGSPAYDVVAGLAYPIDAVPGLSVTAEYRFEQLFDHITANNASMVGSAGTGQFRLGQQSSHSFFLGVRYALFPAPAAAPAPAPVAAPAAAAAPMAAPAPAPARTFLVFFDWDKSDVTPRAAQIIAEAASNSKTQNVTTLDVSGYTDTSGTPTYNMGLSQRRAKAVAGQLVADGVPASAIVINAFGETHLLVPTGANVREPQNRRVEIVLK